MVDIKNPQNITEQFRPEKPPIGAPTRLLTFSFLFLLIAVLVYLGLEFGYKAFLNSRIEETEQRIRQLTTTVSKEDQDKFVVFYSQLVNFKKILDSHVSASKLFGLLERITNQKVFYSNLDLRVGSRDLVLDGVANSYAVLAEQLASFDKEPSVESYVLSQSQFNEGRVQFRITLKLKESVLQ
jgi:hypothetical protein